MDRAGFLPSYPGLLSAVARSNAHFSEAGIEFVSNEGIGAC
jgi:hypothetical protein